MRRFHPLGWIEAGLSLSPREFRLIELELYSQLTGDIMFISGGGRESGVHSLKFVNNDIL
jgi:hypothetical protein